MTRHDAPLNDISDLNSMAVRSAAQVHVYFVLFLAFWRLNWAWKLVTGATLVLLTVYYLPWPFEASVGALWVDALFSAAAALLSAVLIPTPTKAKTCITCYFFCLVAIPFGVLGYARVYIPQTDFPLGICLAAMLALSLCIVQLIVCPHAFTYDVLFPSSVFIWAMIAPDIRFLPVSLALGITVVAFAFREEFVRRKQKRAHSDEDDDYLEGSWSVSNGNYQSDSSHSSFSSEEEEEEREAELQRKRRQSTISQRKTTVDSDDFEIKLNFS